MSEETLAGAAMSAWAALDAPWRECLALAWEAFAAGTIPVGAVLVDADGSIVARGRNRVMDRGAPPGQLAHSLLAHAEVNALVGLDPRRRYRDHVLYSSLEPCLLCAGAVHRATLGTVRFAGAEPHRGVAPHRGRIAPAEHARAHFLGPLDGPFGVLASALVVAFYLHEGSRGDDLVALYERELPAAARAGRHWFATELRARLAPGSRLGDSLAQLWPELTRG